MTMSSMSKSRSMSTADYETIVSYLAHVNGFNTLFLFASHVLAIAALQFIPVCRWQTLVFSGLLYYTSILGVTAGAHRLWAHKSYKAHGMVRFVLMLWHSTANQGSVFDWSRWHRLHHTFADTDIDPHSIRRGFFYAHMGWQLVHPTAQMHTALANLSCHDLCQDWVVAFQHRFHVVLNPVLCYVVPVAIASVLWQEEWRTALLVAGVLRHVAALHATWLPNSAGHVIGNKPYNVAMSARDSVWIALVTLGEGYQNWHHQYPQDYAAGEHDDQPTWQLNTTKAFIDVCAMAGVAGHRQRALHLWGQKKWVLRSRLQDDVGLYRRQSPSTSPNT
ncbi:hypothetical protein DYB32_007302 [Aphanomyces invadans]|uniref:Fatty acid desaturase domain-containing protein n=1 Tax=Aphanomyces invadans TaxID=157072 RepID=A0A3R6VI92_9STRA|nr:hypothetical protein DYB32_007302 [Aphanomyces invadans]